MSSHVITAISHTAELSSETIASVESVLSSLKIEIIDRSYLSPKRVIDYNVQIEASESGTIGSYLKQNKVAGVDLIFQKSDKSVRQDKKLFIFDMDSTLIYQEVIEMIAAYAGVEDKVEEITTAAMNGEIDFSESLAKRVALLKGIDGKIWEELKTKIRITNGARELCKGLKSKGIKMGVLSGGFIPLANYIKEELGLNYAFANQLETEIDPITNKEIFSGKTVGEIVDGQKKADLLLRISRQNDIDPRAAVAVGDGANDLLMMAKAGWGVAWNAKPKVQEQAPCCLNTKSLADIFYILGYNDVEIAKMIN